MATALILGVAASFADNLFDFFSGLSDAGVGTEAGFCGDAFFLLDVLPAVLLRLNFDGDGVSGTLSFVVGLKGSSLTESGLVMVTLSPLVVSASSGFLSAGGGLDGFDEAGELLLFGVPTALLFQGNIEGTVRHFRTIFPVVCWLVKFSRLKCLEQTYVLLVGLKLDSSLQTKTEN